jgi:hypothetical protein
MLPLSWIAKADLFEPTAILPIRSSNMKMATNDRPCIESSMPILGQSGTAPYNKPWNEF